MRPGEIWIQKYTIYAMGKLYRQIKDYGALFINAQLSYILNEEISVVQHNTACLAEGDWNENSMERQ